MEVAFWAKEIEGHTSLFGLAQERALLPSCLEMHLDQGLVRYVTLKIVHKTGGAMVSHHCLEHYRADEQKEPQHGQLRRHC